MTVVDGIFGTLASIISNIEDGVQISENLKEFISENIAVNRSAYFIYTNSAGEKLDNPIVVGNKTEGALLNLIKKWANFEEIKNTIFDANSDKIFAFDSDKKRSTAIIHKKDGSVRLYCKGAAEILLAGCTGYTDGNGITRPLTSEMNQMIDKKILSMANNAYRTILIAHTDFASISLLPVNWKENPPDTENLICDCVVGIVGKHFLYFVRDFIALSEIRLTHCCAH